MAYVATGQGHIVQHQYEFKALTVDNGLSNNHVGSIVQDKNGFMWFGTYNGVDRYDGRSIVSYRHDNNQEHTLSSKMTRVLYCDSQGTLWVGNDGGLDFYNSSLDAFNSFDKKNSDLIVQRVNALVEGKDKTLWIGATNGLFKYNLETGELAALDKKIRSQMPEGQMYRLLLDSKNRLWVSVYQKGVCYYNLNTREVKCFKSDDNDDTSISGNQIERMYEDRQGGVWFGTMHDALNKYNEMTSAFTRIIPDTENDYTNRVRAIFEDQEHNFFVGTRGGLYMKDRKKDSYFQYANSDHKFSTLSQNSILCSYIDKTGSLWLGTFAGGVSYCNTMRKNFIKYTDSKDDDLFLNSPNVYAVCEDDFGNVWVGTDDGINVLDRKTGRFKIIVNDPDDPNSLSYNDTKSLANAGNGNMWIGTNRGGLNFYNHQTKTFKKYRASNDGRSLHTDKIYGLLRDKKGNLWVMNSTGTQSQGFLDMKPAGSEHFVNMSEEAYFGIIEAKDGKIWAGSQGGVLYHDGRGKMKKISNDSLLESVYSLAEDTKQFIWLGTENGIVRLDPKTNEFLSIREVDEHELGIVYGIQEDNSRSLWLSTENGLLKLENIVNDPAQFNLKVYDSYDGLQSKQFNYNASFKNRYGEMMFGGINGMNIFNPAKIKDNEIRPEVVFTDLKVYNKSVKVGKEVGGKVLLEKSLAETSYLEFDRHHKLFSIEFVALHYAESQSNNYMYMLEGLTKEWTHTTSARNFATYNNLPPGNYVFKVNASNADGKWLEKPIEIKIKIKPPFWATLWFRALVVAVIVLIAVSFYRWRINLQKENQKRLERKVTEATEQVNDQNKELQAQSVSLQQAIEETNFVVQEALESGNFNARIDLENKTGEWRALGESINKLFESVVTPFNTINHIVNKMAEGDLTSRFTDEAKGDIEVLAENLNKAIGNLTELLGEITSRAEILKSSSSDMLVTSEEMKVSTGEIASAIAQISKGAQEQVIKIDESSSLIEGVMNSAKAMGAQADSINNTAKMGVEKSDNGKELMNVVDTTMKKIMDYSKDTNVAVDNLMNRSQEISSVLRIIKDVASQTNLLALNAAIEAAQAGEAGRGFAVVAEEIRKLAEDSKKSAAEIEELILGVQHDTSATANLIGEMSASIKEGEEATGHSLSAFEEIYKYYEETLLKSEQIAKDTHSQTADIARVVDLIASVVVIAEQTASGAEETASSSSELSAGMINYGQKSEQVSDIADELRENVGQFKLGESGGSNHRPIVVGVEQDTILN